MPSEGFLPAGSDAAGEPVSLFYLLVNGYQSPLQGTEGGAPYQAVSHTWPTNPATNQPWTVAEVNALEAGIQKYDTQLTADSETRVTQLYVRVQVTNPIVTTTYVYGKDDQLLREDTVGVSVTTYAYDKNGNLKVRVSGSSTTYAYDAEGRLTSVTSPSGTTSYGYTADGRRMKRVSGSATTYFGNDPAGPSGYDDTIEEYGPAGTKTATYLHGVGVDEPLGFKTTAWNFYHRDALGSVTRNTTSTGATASTYRYDAFGAIRAQTGSGNTYGFTSRENEAALGLYYNRARYYDPGTGRFLSDDPIGLAGGANRYAYVGNNPVTRIDPSGQKLEYGFEGGGGGFVVALIVLGAVAYLFLSNPSQPYYPTHTRTLNGVEFHNCGEPLPADPEHSGCTEARQIEGKDGGIYIVEFYPNVPGKPPFYRIWEIVITTEMA